MSGGGRWLRAEAPPAGPVASESTPLRSQLRDEIRAMLSYAWSRGLEVPADVHAQLNMLDGERQPSLSELACLHGGLAKIVAPAMPATLHLLGSDHAGDGLRAILGPIANVRRLMLAAILFTIVFVSISVSPVLNKENMSGDIYTLMGQEQIVVMTFLLSAAGIGAAFQALFTAQRYVADATYEPRYDSSYWIRIVLGFVSGLLLAVLIPFQVDDASSTLAKPVLALLGGFSAGLVYRILQRLVDAVESMFQSSPRSASKLSDAS